VEDEELLVVADALEEVFELPVELEDPLLVVVEAAAEEADEDEATPDVKTNDLL